VKTVQKYTFSPKLQIIGEEIHFNGAHFSKKRKCEHPTEANAEKLAYSAEASRMSAERSITKMRK